MLNIGSLILGICAWLMGVYAIKTKDLYICQDISNTYGEALLVAGEVPLTGQGWFDAFHSNAEILAKQYNHEDLEKYYPVTYLLL